MRFLTWMLLAATLVVPASAHAQAPVAGQADRPPNAVVLSNGQRWERITLRHIDARVLAPLFGATLLPTAEPAWLMGPVEGAPGAWATWSPAISMLLPLLQQGGGGVPFGGGAGAPGPANPAGLPVLVDPVTNALIVDP